jgi:N,N'-diacetyllegionaminate synthase
VINKTLIIAEAGVNHNGDINLAKELVDESAKAGADLVKFQTFTADSMVTQGAPKAAYQKLNTNEQQSQYDMLCQLELTHEMHNKLIEHCHLRGIGFLSTGFDIKSLNYLQTLGLNRFKIPSGEITNLPYLRHIGSFGKELILSTGMSTLDEIRIALQVLELAGTPIKKITVLHCSTEYPTPMKHVNLQAMLTIKKILGVEIGYSDHTLGVEVAIAAVALGAKVIEKHITLNCNLPGPDHRTSLEPKEFTKMVKAIRNIEIALGNGVKRPSLSEIENKDIARKSIVAAKKIKKGEFFSIDNLTTKRPGIGVCPMRWDEAIGSVAPRDFEPDDLIYFK